MPNSAHARAPTNEYNMGQAQILTEPKVLQGHSKVSVTGAVIVTPTPRCVDKHVIQVQVHKKIVLIY